MVLNVFLECPFSNPFKIAGGKDDLVLADWIKTLTYFNPQLTYRKKKQCLPTKQLNGQKRASNRVARFSATQVFARELGIDPKDCAL